MAGDLTGTASSPLAPGVGPLAANGGYTGEFTLTHALLPGSPALDAGSSALVTDLPLDQRGLGFSRLAGPAVDIGAYEFQEVSVAFAKIEPTPAGIRLRLQGPANTGLQIEWNSELRSTDWQPLFSGTTDAAGSLNYTDIGEPAQGKRLYRGILPGR